MLTTRISALFYARPDLWAVIVLRVHRVREIPLRAMRIAL